MCFDLHCLFLLNYSPYPVCCHHIRKMEKEYVHSFLAFLIVSFFLRPNILAGGDSLLKTFCEENFKNYPLNSPFENNLKLLLESWSCSTWTNGFNNTSVGEGRDRVYGQALCRGDVNSTVCRICIENASQEILKQCKRKAAIIWFDLCQVRYSFQNFSSLMVYTGKYPDQKQLEMIKKVSNPDHFDQVLTYLLNSISKETAFDPSKRMFATGEIQFTRKKTIYGLVQCTMDMAQEDCHKCLDSALKDLQACCSSLEGGFIVSRNCNARFQLYRFYNGSGLMLTYPTSNDDERSQNALIHELSGPMGVDITEEGELISSEELPFMNLSTLMAATDNFSDSNKLGIGGFGTVYKGVLPDGKTIAVKRLSRKSWQGLEEFKNEIKVIAKLQHRNLVKLLGCAIEGHEKLVVYEFMPNRSLDLFIFDSKKRSQLEWKTCYDIIVGIARGLLYLHEDSRLKIIHRDLKPNNVLLDHEMVVKISDFGMARIFGVDQNTANTRRVVGTYGYMAPEYAMEGLFSVKSDVYSFGVILLEIISGRKNSGFHLTGQAQPLLVYAWKLWNEGKEMKFMDPLLMESCMITQILKCMHIGLLCVQEDPADRPTISMVVVLLGKESIPLPKPKQPALSVGRVIQIDRFPIANPSVNDLTVSIPSPR
ncbi:cysteine-rich receptor-like protein kinase 15 isoform X2 [Juglans microcarpa x Juglans regia]|uniref:cysteine-rich receptor-like protein kinase 15 isoform X2 n=1 Tax=Juglans microcarpa x Juglans regia TaxID=2249226 RepID=UPI001B7ECB96|nr:cysteine-rich receptor-like protein kinase 15 isoform X2 [Juglans microcarpa x Juglans regia]